jgi:hypothetical protein
VHNGKHRRAGGQPKEHVITIGSSADGDGRTIEERVPATDFTRQLHTEVSVGRLPGNEPFDQAKLGGQFR